MSTTKAVTIWCDGPGCTEWSEFQDMPAVTARAILARGGWHPRPQSRDICPACWADGHR